MKKSYFRIMLFGVFLVSIMAFNIMKEEKVVVYADILEYKVWDTIESFNTETGVLTITGTGTVRTQEYPEFIHTREYDFPWDNYLVREVIIEEGITKIDRQAFCENYNITKITLPDSLVEIEYDAFCDTKIREIIIPESVEYIGSSAFSGCNNLETIIIEGKIDYSLTLSDTAFYKNRNNWENGFLYLKNAVMEYDNNYSLTNKEVVLREGITFINSGVFERSGLNKIVFPEGLRIIGNSVGSYCEDLSIVYIPKSVTKIGSNSLFQCPNLTIYCYEGSYAEEYAKMTQIMYDTNCEDIIIPSMTPTPTFSADNYELGDIMIIDGIVLIKGDVDMDESINAEDALIVLKCASKLIRIDNYDLVDMNNDNKINAKDALCILKYSAKIE